MKDFLGNDLQVGDNVVALKYVNTSARLLKGVVLSITNKFVKVSHDYDTNVGYFSPEKVVKINDNKAAI